MQFARYFSIHIQHEYYREGLCPDFAVIPTADTVRKLKGHKMQLIRETNGVRFNTQVEADKSPFIQLADPDQLAFLLELVNPAFLQITDLEAPETGQIRYYTNDSIKPGSDELVMQHMSIGDLDATIQQGIVATRSAGKNVWAVVVIKPNNTLPNPVHQPATFSIRFEARSRKWSYYLVAGKNGGSYTIEDKQGKVLFGNKQLSEGAVATAGEPQFVSLTEGKTWDGSRKSTKHDWQVSPDGRIQSFGPYSKNHFIYTRVENTLLDDIILEFTIDVAFAPSSSNYLRAYLAADRADFTDAGITGMLIQMGETGDDFIRVFRVVNGTGEQIRNDITGQFGSVSQFGGNLSVKLTVKRSKAGEWEIYAANPDGSGRKIEFTFTDTEITSTSYFGFAGYYASASRYRLYAFENVRIASVAPQEVAEQSATGDPFADALARLYPDARHLVFESDQPIAYHEDGRKFLQLKRDGNVLIPHLSNPRPDDNGRKLIKAIS